jgi:glycosyltransferase involved in cell wall biosynthesis
VMEPSYPFVPRYLSGESAWTGHIPFAYDLVRSFKPSLLVELGTWSGDSFFAFCQGVADHLLSTRCYTIDHWKGDDQAGEAPEAQFARVQAYCTATYPTFAYLMRTDFDSAAREFSDQSIDLLHIDGLHTYEAVSGDFATWFPKVRSGGVVLLHDICARGSEDHRDFGVWKLWEQLKAQHRTFEFSHAYGLGVLIKDENPEIETWLRTLMETSLGVYYAARGSDLVSIITAKHERDAVRHDRDVLRHERDELRRNLDAAYRQTAESAERMAKLNSDIEELKITRFEAKRECHSLKTSLSWRVTWPLRVVRDRSAAVLNRLKSRRNLLLTSKAKASPTLEASTTRPDPAASTQVSQLDAKLGRLHASTLPMSDGNGVARSSAPARHTGRRVIFISGEPKTPGHTYRVRMPAEALAKSGAEVRIIGMDEVARNQGYIESADAVVIWRAAWCEEIESAISAARKSGTKIIFDVDDLMVDPALAKTEVIDGIRSQGFAECSIGDLYARIQKCMVAADYCTCPTRPLASAMRDYHKSVFLLPNGFDETRYRRSRMATAERARAGSDGLFRIGYAAGSRTHQKDFSCAVVAVARVLREHPECRLVLFRLETSADYTSCLIPEEFPELDGLAHQIEWRRLVPVDDLSSELIRFDINLAPLEVGNSFCEAKSELKYLEAALVGVPTVASPTVPFADAIRHGTTGFLASSTEEWYESLKRLVEDPELRRQVGTEAFLDVLWKYGPERRAELAAGILEQVVCGSAAAAREFELELRRTQAWNVPRIDWAEFESVFEFGARAASEMAVVVPLYNYAEHVVEALESVKAQTARQKELIVVDDCSTDDSLAVASGWLRSHAVEFTHVALLKNRKNSGLALTRNTGFVFSDARFIMPLDADNTIEPNCLERCLEVINATGAAAAYPLIQTFGDNSNLLNTGHWKPTHFTRGNYIDAMALVRRAAWSAVGGYRHMKVMGWEDFEMWCRFLEHGFWAAWVPEPLARYRSHSTSMIHAVKNQLEKQRQLISEIHDLHPWLDLASLRRAW